MRTGRDGGTFRMISVPLVALGIWCCLVRAADAPDSGKPASVSTKAPSFDAFRILIDRNIFDASRKPLTGSSQEGDASELPSRTLRLMGTWMAGDRAVALFEGMPEETHETLERGGDLVGYRIEDIRPDAVVLRNEQATSELRVGAGLAKGENGVWTAVESVTPTDQPAARTQEATTPRPAPASATPDKAADDAAASGPVKRLLKHIRKGLGS